MRLSYNKRLFLYVAVIFSLFTVGVIFIWQSRERQIRTEALVDKLSAYAEVTHNILCDSNLHEQSFSDILPDSIRLTLISLEGVVYYDSSVPDVHELPNHSARPEIKSAHHIGEGYDIRHSNSTDQDYLYYTKRYTDGYIRIALPYDMQVSHLLEPDRLFLYIVLGLFVLVIMMVNMISHRFGSSIRQLRDFAISVATSKDELPRPDFPPDELGEISQTITDNYITLKENRRKLSLEREKLLQHTYMSEEGICFYSSDRQVEFYNGLFLTLLNSMTDHHSSDPLTIFVDDIFAPIIKVIDEGSESYYETTIRRDGKSFSIRVNIFKDKSFELVINNITKQEKTRQMKQELTGNIAHELRTPVTAIRGYLETIIDQDLDRVQQQYFIDKAYSRVLTLSELMQDISLLSKIEDAPQNFSNEEVSINELLDSLYQDFSHALNEHHMTFTIDVPTDSVMKGNYHLVYSLFRNLLDNAIRYAGDGSKIRVSLYRDDDDYYYFSFADNGVGVDDEVHLNRLFERFYRVSEGRTRDTGGSGLGLSIVKNAVAFHKGSITAKSCKDGGLEFLFHLHK